MLIVCAIGYGILIYTIGIYAFFGSWEKAFIKPQSKSTSNNSSVLSYAGNGPAWLDLILLALSFLVSICSYPKHWLCLFLGTFAGIGSNYIYTPLFSEILLVCGFAAVLVWRQFRIKNTINGKPEVSAHIPQLIQHPPPTQPEPEDPDLKQVYEICIMYLVALDEQFTPEEQGKVDQHFGPGTAERFIQLLPTLDWKEQFVVLHDMVQRLSAADRYALKTNGRTLFQSILAVDELTNAEKTGFEDLMRFIEDSIEQPQV